MAQKKKGESQTKTVPPAGSLSAGSSGVEIETNNLQIENKGQIVGKKKQQKLKAEGKSEALLGFKPSGKISLKEMAKHGVKLEELVLSAPLSCTIDNKAKIVELKGKDKAVTLTNNARSRFLERSHKMLGLTWKQLYSKPDFQVKVNGLLKKAASITLATVKGEAVFVRSIKLRKEKGKKNDKMEN